jgi:hypothetical protein
VETVPSRSVLAMTAFFRPEGSNELTVGPDRFFRQ